MASDHQVAGSTPAGRTMKKNWQLFALFILIGIYIIYFTTASFLRYDNFYTGRFDLGNMDQTVWNTAQGRIFQTSDNNGNITSRLYAHADFLLILLAPFYLIWSHPKMLLLILTITLAFGAVFIYLISNLVLKKKTLSLIFSFSYLLFPTVGYNNLYDFHAVSLAITFLLGAFYFILTNKYKYGLIFLLLAALTKEQVWLITALFGLFITIKNIFSKTQQKYAVLTGIAVFLISIFIFYFLIWHAIPNTRGKQHFALSFYSEFGDNPSNIIKNVLARPEKTFSIVMQKERIEYLKQLFGPLGYLSLFSPQYLIFALPDLGINLLSGRSSFHQIYYQYTATITPFIFISAIYGTKNLMKIFPRFSTNFITLFLLISILYQTYLLGPVPWSKKPNIKMFLKPQKNKEVINKFLTQIPKEYFVAATNNLGSHLSQRQRITTIPDGIEKASLILFLLNNPNHSQTKEFEKIIEDLRDNPNYKEVLSYENFVVFKPLAN